VHNIWTTIAISLENVHSHLDNYYLFGDLLLFEMNGEFMYVL